MAKSFSSKLRMELTCIWTSLSRKCCFYCIGRPIYPNPLYQQQVFGARNELPVKKKPPPWSIINAVKNIAARVTNRRLACRLQRIPETPMNDEQIHCAAEIILAAIDYAAALDLDRQPWLSRTNKGKFTMYPASTKNASRCLKIWHLNSLSCSCFP